MGQSLLEVLRTVALDTGERSAFEADPAGYMDAHGYGDVPLSDLQEAVGLVADTLPPDVARTVAPAGADAGGSGGLLEPLQRLEEPGEAAAAPGGATGTADDPATSFGDADFDNGAARGEPAEVSGAGAEPAGGRGAAGDGPDEAMGFGTGSAPGRRDGEDAPDAPDGDVGTGPSLDQPDASGTPEPASDDPDEALAFGDARPADEIPESDEVPEPDEFTAAEDVPEPTAGDEGTTGDDLDVGAF